MFFQDSPLLVDVDRVHLRQSPRRHHANLGTLRQSTLQDRQDRQDRQDKIHVSHYVKQLKIIHDKFGQTGGTVCRGMTFEVCVPTMKALERSDW